MNKVWDDLPKDLKRNPFFQFSEKTSYVPAWDKITAEHIEPAMDYALDLMRRNIQKITDNPAPANFKNTVEALEESGELSGYFFGVLFNLMPGIGKAEDDYDATVQKVQRKYGEMHGEIYRDNVKLRDRILAVSKSPSFKTLSPERKHLWAMYKNTFVDGGANLPEKKRAAMRALDERITELEFRSMNNMKLAEREFMLVVDDPKRLAGLSESTLADAAKRANEKGHPGKWAFDLGRATYTSFMSSCADRDLRKQLWRAWETQGSHGQYDNRKTILELVKLQQERAKLLGYRSAAAYNLSYNMALQTTTVSKFLTNLRRHAMPAAKREMAELQKFAKTNDHIKLEPWDVKFYEERLKKDVLGYDEEQLRPYFELENVLKGCFNHFEKLLGIRFEETKDYPVYHQDVRAFNVYKKGSDTPAGIVFMDLYARDGKPPGTAWDAGILSQGIFEGKNRRPIDMIVTKFQKGEPTLLTHYDLQTLIHEIGHASHNLCSDVRYPSLAGTSVSGDFVEFPSQFHENYGFEPEFLDSFAVHYQTGEKMPDDLKEKVQRGAKFMAGSQTLEYAKRGWLDLSWYRADPKKLTSVEAFEKAATASYQLLPRHGALHSPHFSHLFGGGYEANFYSYQWSQRMEADAFSAFKEKGLYDRGLAKDYKSILARGGSEWASKLFYGFRHRNPLDKFMLDRAGLLKEHFNYAADPQAAPQAGQDSALQAAFGAGAGGKSPAIKGSGITITAAGVNDNQDDDLSSVRFKGRPGPRAHHYYG